MRGTEVQLDERLWGIALDPFRIRTICQQMAWIDVKQTWLPSSRPHAETSQCPCPVIAGFRQLLAGHPTSRQPAAQLRPLKRIEILLLRPPMQGRGTRQPETLKGWRTPLATAQWPATVHVRGLQTCRLCRNRFPTFSCQRQRELPSAAAADDARQREAVAQLRDGAAQRAAGADLGTGWGSQCGDEDEGKHKRMRVCSHAPAVRLHHLVSRFLTSVSTVSCLVVRYGEQFRSGVRVFSRARVVVLPHS